MAEHNIPYLTAYGYITKALEGIKAATTPDRFTQDFLATKLALKGGSPKPVIPFLKRTGFLNSDGSPTDIYKEFRNPNFSGAAAARATRKGFASLYAINEYAHDLSDAELRGVIIQATGADKDSTLVKSILGSFKALAAFGEFDNVSAGPSQMDTGENSVDAPALKPELGSLRLGYTINLNLPATSDVAVFNAIFKSLRENLLK